MSLDDESQRFFLEALENAGITVSRVDRTCGLAIPAGVRRKRVNPFATSTYASASRPGSRKRLYLDFLARRPDIVHLWLDK